MVYIYNCNSVKISNVGLHLLLQHHYNTYFHIVGTLPHQASKMEQMLDGIFDACLTKIRKSVQDDELLVS